MLGLQSLNLGLETLREVERSGVQRFWPPN